MSEKKKKPRRPRKIIVGNEAYQNGFEIVEGETFGLRVYRSGFPTYHDKKDCRKLATWLNKAAEYLEAKEKK